MKAIDKLFRSPKLIQFRRLDSERWETAFDEEHLRHKLDGEMAEVIMPAKPFWVRIWRLFFPLMGVHISGEVIETIVHQRPVIGPLIIKLFPSKKSE